MKVTIRQLNAYANVLEHLHKQPQRVYRCRELIKNMIKYGETETDIDSDSPTGYTFCKALIKAEKLNKTFNKNCRNTKAKF